MAQQIIDISTPNDGLGDTLRDGGDKINDNFTELYGVIPQAQDWAITVERQLLYDDFGNATEYARMLGEIWTGTGSATAAYAGDDNNLPGQEHRTSATLNNSYTLDTATVPALHSYRFLKYRLQCVWFGRLFSTNGFFRIWLVFTSATAVNFIAAGGSEAPLFNFVGFRASSVGGGNWFACSGDGANTTIVDTNIAISTTHMQTFGIEWDRDGSAVRFYINRALVATITTTLPATSTQMRNLSTITNLTSDATVRSLLINAIKIREGIANPFVS